MKTVCIQKASPWRLAPVFLASVLLLLASGPTARATIYTWNSGVSGSWSDGSDWTPAGVPGSGDTAIISSGTVTVGSAVTVAEVILSGSGTLTGDPVTVSGPFYWSGGYLENTVQFDGGTNGGNCFLEGGQLINVGTWYWNGSIYDGAGSVISNASSAIINMTNFANSATAYFTYNNYGAPQTFDNAGRVYVAAGGGNTGAIDDSLTNSGLMTVLSGTLSLNNGGSNTESGELVVPSPGSALEFSGGTFSFYNVEQVTLDDGGNLICSGGTVNLAGIVSVLGTNIFSGATVNVAGLYPIGTPMVVSGGTVNLAGTGQFTPTVLTMSGGTLSGSAVDASGPFYWSGGYIQNTVQFDGGTNGGNCFLEGGRIINQGTWYWNGSIYDGGGSVISNAPDATMYMNNFANSTTAYFTYNNYGAPQIFYNAGTVDVTAGPGNTGNIYDSLTNSGVIEADTGTLNFAGGGDNANNIASLNSTASLQFSGGTFTLNNISSVYPNGNLIFSGGTVNVAGIVNVGGTNFFSGATVNVTGDYVINTPMVVSGGTVNLGGIGQFTPTALTMSGGTLSGSAVDVTGPFYWSGGYIENTVQFEGGTNGGNNFLDGGHLINEGTWAWNGSIYDGAGSVISNAPGATINMTNFANSTTAYFTYNNYGAPQIFNNGGTVNVSAAFGHTGAINDSLTNWGTLSIVNGTLSLSQTPNLANGTLNFGISSLTSYGVLALSGAASLAGTLTATMNPSLVPATGDEWPVITYGSLSGSFSKVSLPPIGDWEEIANPADYIIEIKQTGPAPFFEQNLATTNYAIVGGPAVMSTEAGGTGPFTNQWYYEGGGVPIALENGGRISGATSLTLTIADAQTNDDGPYQVFVTNGFAPYFDESSVGQLVVELEPLFNGNGALWTLNGGATIQNNVLELTDGQQSQASSAFYYVPMYDEAFRVFFTYQSAQGTTSTKGDGITFCVQNTTAGTGAIGTGGGSLGYAGITNSLAVAIDQFTAKGIEVVTNGTDPASPDNYIVTAPVDPSSGDPINVSILYENKAISLCMTDMVTLGTFVTNITLNQQPITGTNDAFVGFTGGDGAVDSVQTISNFSFAPIPRIAVSNSAPNVILSWPTAIGGYQLQSTTNLLTGPWVALPGIYNVTGSQYQYPVSPVGNEFYRLMVTTH